MSASTTTTHSTSGIAASAALPIASVWPGCGGEYSVQALHKVDSPPGPAGRWLIERLVTLSDGVATPISETTQPIEGKRRRPSRKRAVTRKPRRRIMDESGPADGPYLDDLRVGQRFTSATHVIDAAQIMAFAIQEPQSLRRAPRQRDASTGPSMGIEALSFGLSQNSASAGQCYKICLSQIRRERINTSCGGLPDSRLEL
jgi:hypothetical protein